MSTDNTLQRQIIARLISQRPQEIAHLTLGLWDSIASELIPLVGEDGFAMLYGRSLYLTKKTFPWLPDGQTKLQNNSPFLLLKASLEKQDTADAATASQALLMTFTDLLATLIGEPLTIGILRAAWGDDVPDTSKESAS